MTESLSLYRRHRPGSFDEVVGQQHVVRTLRNAVEQGKVHHAHLFVGSRGTGKTSMAKILARSLNCERGGPTPTPCGECESCRSIAGGTSVDVIEMDAASNRSVEDIRELRERVAYAPASGGWKVYILDEAHMLTKEAWNAFLKTLEEPPPNTVFVLATTEAHKVMPTIADRCQRFDFQRPSLEQIATVLRRVADSEGIEIEDAAVAMVARAAAGSFRDALGTLDQLVVFNGSKVELAAVLDLLGAVDTELLFDAVDAVAAEDPAGALRVVERMASSGRDAIQFARDLLDHLRQLLLIQTAGELPDGLIVAAEDAGRLSSQAGSVGGANLIRTIDELAAALAAARSGDEARMAVEIALLKAARPDLDPSTQGLTRRLERLERHLTPPTSPTPPTGTDAPVQPSATDTHSSPEPRAPEPSAGETARPAPTPGSETSPEAASTTTADSSATDSSGETARPEPTPGSDEASAAGGAGSGDRAEDAPQGAPAGVVEPNRRQDPPPESMASPEHPSATSTASPEGPPPASNASPEDSLTLEQARRIWPAVLDHLRQTGQDLLAALFDGTRPVAVDPQEGTLEIGFPPQGAFNRRQAEEGDRRKVLAAALEHTFGERLRPTFSTLEGDAEPAQPDRESGAADEDEIVEQIKSQFNAEEVN